MSALDARGRTIWIADAHRDDGKRYVARADEKLAAFMELESVVRSCASNNELLNPTKAKIESVMQVGGSQGLAF